MIETIPSENFIKTEACEKFLPIIKQMVQNSLYTQQIDEIYQPCNEKNQHSVLEIVGHMMRPESRIINIEALEKAASLIKLGKSCLFLPEHFSNFDYPGFFYLCKKHPSAAPLIENLVCMAASKLNTESKVVLAFSEAFHRILIYPARAKQQTSDAQLLQEQKKLDLLNQHALRKMNECKKEARAILMFPSGTRFRPNNPDSRNALPQVASFIKQFDYFCMVGIAGNLLMVNPNNQMAQDIAREDAMIYCIDDIQESKAFLSKIHADFPAASLPEFKNIVAQKITALLLELHKKAEAARAPLIENNPPRYLGPLL